MNDDKFEVSFKMIAPPLFKIETITLEKAKGVSKLEEALGIIEGVMKEKKGTFKIINKPTILGHNTDKDIEEIYDRMGEENENSEEDNEEGIDIDLEEENKSEDDEEGEDEEEK